MPNNIYIKIPLYISMLYDYCGGFEKIKCVNIGRNDLAAFIV